MPYDRSLTSASFGHLIPDAAEQYLPEQEEEVHDIIPFTLSPPDPDEVAPSSPRVGDSPTLGDPSGTGAEFDNAGLAESVRNFETSLRK